MAKDAVKAGPRTRCRYTASEYAASGFGDDSACFVFLGPVHGRVSEGFGPDLRPYEGQNHLPAQVTAVDRAAQELGLRSWPETLRTGRGATRRAPDADCCMAV